MFNQQETKEHRHLMSTTRRMFLQSLGAAVAASPASPLRAAEPDSNRLKLREFHYSDVTITEGPFKRQYDRIHAHFLSLDNDRLLKVYRQRAGLPAPGDDMGGWYDADGFVPGHALGQFLSALSRIYATTGDAACRAKVQTLVEGYAATLGPHDDPYASEKAAVTWPCYILDKYEIGLLDACRLAGIGAARELLARVIRGAIPHLPDHTYDRGPDSPKQAPYDEPYILPENLFHSYELTGEKQFLSMARLYLLDREYFEPLAQNQNVLPGKHAYSHVIALSSAAKAYQSLGDPKYLEAIRNAWDMLVSTQQFASGGWGPKETFVEPHQGKLAESLTATRDHFETPCGCYAHTKLARYLLQFTGEGRYGDGLEQVLYNTILAAKDPGADGEYFYYSDYQALAQKRYYKRKWPCCAGTLAQTVSDYPINIYFHSPDAIWVNLYTPSEVRWRAHGVPVKLMQRTNYPDSGSVEFRLNVPAPVEFAIRVRVPAWLSAPPQLDVNGKNVDAELDRGFASIRRRWKNNDTLEITLPFGLRTLPIDDRNQNLVALMAGPVLLVATNPPADLAANALPLLRLVKPLPQTASAYAMTVSGQQVVFTPFYRVGDEVYTTYFRNA
jgi:DUF1680 family protein